ncbi:HCL416Wp [Eremothecium sinecaudum]|uniref:HCL416Wp n=1 Tax=Eremothecium sinecaudum TaxID=45286 RepID=A0A109UW98_9SACH|nr:HCL416Wp [Eremothecium sinecaudum]AMD19735.1 HCL416Wp [Eremothecium sinecaudum]
MRDDDIGEPAAIASPRGTEPAAPPLPKLPRKKSLHYQDIKTKFKSTRNKLFKHDLSLQLNLLTAGISHVPEHITPILNKHGENYVILGSTGLTGSMVLQGFMSPWVGASLTEDTVTRTYWCFNRNKKSLEINLDKLPQTWTAIIEYSGEQHILRKNDVVIRQHIVEQGKLGHVECHWDQYDWGLVLPTGEVKNIVINVVQLIESDSNKWCETFTNLFTGARKLLDDRTPIYLPSVDQISTLVSTLGSSSWESRKEKTTRSFVDYTLNLQLAKAFAPDATKSTLKHMVIVTSFNNLALGVISPYFRTKQKLENDLTHEVPGLTHLTILRPGPLVGQHGKQLSLLPTAPEGCSIIYRCYFWKKNAVKARINWLSQVRDVGPSKKVSEIVARATYHLPGNWLVGYSIPAAKVARVATQEALAKRTLIEQDPTALVVEVTTWSSQEMDKAFAAISPY